MRKVRTSSTLFAVLPFAISLLGCGSNSDSGVTSVRAVPYYEVYDSRGVLTSSGVGKHPYASSSSKVYKGTSFAGQPQSQYPRVATRPSTSAAPSKSKPAVKARSQPAVQTVSVRKPAPRKSPGRLLSEVKVRKDYISPRARGRRDSRSMRPRYITIHSTQNWSSGADAWRHSLALKRSKLGRLSWHYTTDENVAVQHLPTNVTGNHADFDGPGNRYSIGIEMCEHPGNSRGRTVDRTAKLTAYLMHKYDIPLSKVVPHYHWPRRGMRPAHKNCPHFLLDNGRPGRKWRGFQAKVKKYHDDITKGGSVYVSR